MTRIEQYLGMSEAEARDMVLARIRTYVEHETPSYHATEITALAEVIEQDLRDIGAEVERRVAPGLGRNLIVRFDATRGAGRGTSSGDMDARRPLLALAHIDTVHALGTIAARPFRIEDGRAYGPGVYDMKAGVALLVEALHWHHRRQTELRRPVTLLLTCDEEVGSHSVRPLIDELARNAEAVLVPEPCMPDGGVKTGRKGVATYRIDTTGVAAHAGIEPGTAVSAITELVRQSLRILALADHSKGTTINIGTIEGGTATNVVAASASAGIDVRLAVAEEGPRVHDTLMSLRPLSEATVTVTLAESRPPLVRNEQVARVFEHARALAARLGQDLAEGSTGGGSDGSLAAATGAAVLDGLGPRGGGAHAESEHIIIDDLPFRLALLCRLIETI
jgi:glutamate carboxypeptidase